ESILSTIQKSVATAGYDETSLTSLSTADYSAITPLVKAVARKLAGKRVSMSVSSLRAYGLGEDILDELAKTGINGLTFAPEAGTQRMRDVVNKNVSEAHIAESSERVFSRGWNRLKLYFMIGLPTETDEDVAGIVDTGERMLRIGRRHVGNRGEVTVSVSSHVPKPHTPFQWCAQDAAADIDRKQALLRGRVRERGLKLKVHDSGESFLEGVLARGDRRLADAIELAWQRGARFDSWSELFDGARWRAAFAETGVDIDAYLGTRPISARLPWDHIDVGLEDGFLLAEYRKALKNRLSPPCGKVAGQIIHHENLAEATADGKKLVCYDCGVACDLANMRSARLEKLVTLGATEPAVRSAPVMSMRKPPRGKRKPPVREVAEARAKFRIRYTKLGRIAFLGHLDTARVVVRLFRRAGIELSYTSGFRPKPKIELGPALALGVASFGELIDVSVMSDISADALLARLSEVAPEGMAVTGVWRLPEPSRGLGKVVAGYDLLLAPPRDAAWDPEALAASFLAREHAEVVREKKTIDVRPLVEQVEVVTGHGCDKLVAALSWADVRSLLRCRVAVLPDGSARPREVAAAIGGDQLWPASLRAPRARMARLGFAFKPTAGHQAQAPWAMAGPGANDKSAIDGLTARAPTL
ncbi:MAG TPA: TIGR03936 family radical SAM-associated protein, partial [Kofleriaceae bacterium]|nr:TIGR03936 family radical SAM-associated protein [Kofleriaceae bacterium]